jgi:hypothetical protein
MCTIAIVSSVPIYRMCTQKLQQICKLYGMLPNTRSNVCHLIIQVKTPTRTVLKGLACLIVISHFYSLWFVCTYETICIWHLQTDSIHLIKGILYSWFVVVVILSLPLIISTLSGNYGLFIILQRGHLLHIECADQIPAQFICRRSWISYEFSSVFMSLPSSAIPTPPMLAVHCAFSSLPSLVRLLRVTRNKCGWCLILCKSLMNPNYQGRHNPKPTHDLKLGTVYHHHPFQAPK